MAPPIKKETELAVLNFGELDLKKSTFFIEKKKSIKGIVKKNAVIKITDNKTYELAKASRTAVKTLRTGLEKEKTEVGKKIKEAINEKVASEYDTLIEEVRKEEETRQKEVTAWEDKKEKERILKEEAEIARKEKLFGYVDTVKADLEKIIVATDSFDKIDHNKKQFNSVVDISAEYVLKGIDLEEFQVDYDDMISSRSEAFQTVINNLTTAHDLEQKNKALAISELTNERNNELFDYGYRYKGETPLGELDEEEYAEVMVPERTKFRIGELEASGFTKSVSEESYIYCPNENLILLTVSVEHINRASKVEWENEKEYLSEEIGRYEEGEPVAETEAVEEEVAEEVKETETITEEKPFYRSSAGGGLGSIKLNDKITEEPLELSGSEKEKEATPVQKLIDLLISRGFTEEFIESTLNPVLVEEREKLIEFYNYGQIDTFRIVTEEVVKHNPELINELSINQLDAIDCYDNKFKS